MAVRRAQSSSIFGETFRNASPFPTMEGGAPLNNGGYRIHTFTASATLQVYRQTACDILVVAAGGRARNIDHGGGGGGAGGYIYTTGHMLGQGTFNITVGQGTSTGNGGNSIIDSLTAVGGGAGYGTGYNGGGAPGGSGGGANGLTSGGTPIFGGNGTAGQGYAGGRGFNNIGSQSCSGGGGGGAGGPGADNTSASSSASGGAGLSNSISGIAVTYARGGNGAPSNNSAGGPGTNNTGNGADGPGGSLSNDTEFAGGSGIIILRYPIP